MRACVYWLAVAAKVLPNLRIIVRDGACASRRITKQPWLADQFIREVVDQTLGANANLYHNQQSMFSLHGLLYPCLF